MANKSKTFGITAKIEVEVNLNIKATGYADALRQAKELEPTDFVKILGDYNDGNVKSIVYIGCYDEDVPQSEL